MVENKEIAMTPLFNALTEVKNLFCIEADLVRPGAEHHGVSIVEGNILTPMKEHSYNPRVPEATKEEIQAIKNTDRFAVICEDYRQSYEVVRELNNPPVVLSTAGGPDQPDGKRRMAIAHLLKESYAVNPAIKFDLVFHNGICGGCKHFTDGETARIQETYGVDGENAIMEDFALALVQDTVALGVPTDAIRLYRSNVGDDDTFCGLTPLNINMPER
jgi:hypothetical protein